MRQHRSSRVRRVIVQATLFLMLGAIVNIAVAWGIAIWPPTAADAWGCTPTQYHKTGSPLILSASTKWGRAFFGRTWWTYEFDETVEVDASTFRSMYPSWSQCSDTELSNPKLSQSDTRFLWETASGWPCLALSSWILHQVAFPSKGIAENHGSLSLSPLLSDWDGSTRVPYLPIWTGFALNTLFYAAVLWLVVSVRHLLPYSRRRRLIKRGLCPACAYPVGTSEVCTECGRPVKGSSVELASS